MAFQPVPDVAEVIFRLSGDPSIADMGGSTAQFAFYVRDTIGGWTQNQIDNLMGVALDWFDTEAVPLLNPGWVRTSISVKDIGAANGNEAIDMTAGPGTRAGTTLPSNVAVLVKYRCDSGGDPDAGHNFLPFGSEADVSGNGYVGTFAADVLDGVNAWQTMLSAEDSNWASVRISRYLGTEDVTVKRATRRSGDGESNTLAAISIGPTITQQRKRRRPPF